MIEIKNYRTIERSNERERERIKELKDIKKERFEHADNRKKERD